MKVYLGGPIDPANANILRHCLEWRNHAGKELARADIGSINPMRGDNHPVAGGKLDSIPAPPASIVARDLFDISQCDMLLVYWPEASKKRGIGTLMEIGIAYDRDIPVVLVDPGNAIAEHPWIQVCCTEIYPTLSIALEAIENYWGA